MLIYVCLSGHGYGHGSRVASVLSCLHALEPTWRLVLSTPLSQDFLSLAMGQVPFELRSCRWDVGVIQADALGADPEATLEALEQLERQLPAQLDDEVDWICAQAEPVLLLSDVAPAAAGLRQRLGAPLIWMGNFGWDVIYRPMGGAFVPWAEHCLQAYRQGTALIACPLNMEMPWGLPSVPVGLTAGRPRCTPEQIRQRLGLSGPRERTILMGFGGMGLSLAHALFGRWPAFQFLVSDPGLAASAPNVTVVPSDWRPLEVMQICSRVITKPGYSTFCEALSQGLGVHLVHREGFAEAPVLEAALQRHGRHRLLSRAQLEAGDWQLDQPLLAPTGQPLTANGAEEAAAFLQAQGLRANFDV